MQSQTILLFLLWKAFLIHARVKSHYNKSCCPMSPDKWELSYIEHWCKFTAFLKIRLLIFHMLDKVEAQLLEIQVI